MSQKVFAQRLDISYQQVQKYESGSSRLMAWRLFVISRVLAISVPELLGLRSVEPLVAEREESVRLVEAWSRIPSEPLRGHLLRVIETLALEAEGEDAARSEPWTASTN